MRSSLSYKKASTLCSQKGRGFCLPLWLLSIGRTAGDGPLIFVMGQLLAVQKTIGSVVIDHAGSLHEGIADGGTDEIKAPFAQCFAHCI